jgi:hypothetical protein
VAERAASPWRRWHWPGSSEARHHRAHRRRLQAPACAGRTVAAALDLSDEEVARLEAPYRPHRQRGFS